MQPTLEDAICDPSAQTAGFLAAAKEYIDKEMFNDTEFDATMLRITSINLFLHCEKELNIRDVDAVSKDNKVAEAYTLVLANPSF